MNRILVRFAVLALAAFFAAAPLAAQQYPAEPGDGVADMAGIIGPADADSLRAMLASLRTDAGVEVRVLTVKNIARYGTNDATPEAFATSVYNDWKLGLGQRQDGVLVLVSVDDRFARIELGDEVPAQQDARMQDIMDSQMVPHFREGNFDDGVMDGVRAIAASFRGSGYAASPQPGAGFSDPRPAYDAPATGTGNDDGVVAGVVGVLILVSGVAGGAHYLRNRKRNCAECGKPMQRLDESADNVHLDSGRQLEEVLGSVDYDVWQCTGCSHHQVLPYPAMFSSKKDCPSCGYKTVIVTSTVIEHATYDHSGRERVEKDCRHCGWNDVDIVHLPRKERPTSSSSRSFSSSGGSSSGGSSGGGWSGRGGGGGGGGSSSGRGASGRW
ncbi:TPM domain-containing protein [Longimicrobium sp.]|uniref:TPM domain-containing protein n=1 Tax=Longimicrobium sp. TaxID=2029185 RepID=UPI003B3AEEDA